METKSLNTEEYIKLVKESPEKKRGYIFTVITLVISLLLIVFAIRPTVVTILTINSGIKEKNRLITALDTKINTLTALDKQYADVGDQLKDLKLIYPAKGDFSLLMANIEPILARNSFVLSGLSFDKYDSDNFDLSPKILIPWTIRLSVRGSSANIVNLLKDIEKLPMYPVIEGFSYSDQKDKDGLTSYSINLRIYKVDNVNFYE